MDMTVLILAACIEVEEFITFFKKTKDYFINTKLNSKIIFTH
ncbi:MAG: hypothetical protein V1773_11495 [bacterium]